MIKLKLIERKERLRLTIISKLTILLFIILIFTLVFRNLSIFLAVSDPVNTKLLVIEGWLPDKVLESVINEFYEKDYDNLIITGKPTERGYYISDYKTSADIAEKTLIGLGFDKNKIEKIAIPRTITKDRTYANAVSLFYYLKKTKSKYTSFNIYTLGCHSRRSKILFQSAFPEKFNIGVISGKDESYDKNKWWNSSRGFRTVTGEALAYLYVKLFFFPDNEKMLKQIIDGYYIDKINEHRRSTFLEFKIPKTDTIIIDFNLAYNPYCAYNYKYSCPIPPDKNKLDIRIMAGEIKFD